MRRFFILAAVGIFLVGLVVSPKLLQNQSDHRIIVTTSFYPLYYFTKEIGQDKIDAVNLTPAGAEPHDYEPSTRDLSQIEKSSVLVLNGKHLEAWGDKIKDNLRNQQIDVLTVTEDIDTANPDPHVWLDPVLAQKEVAKIASALIKADPINTDFYQKNAQNLEARLADLDQQFKTGLQNCQQKNIVTSHAAFGYVATRYGLQQVAIAGLSPDEEPSPKKLAEVALFAKENSIKYIFFESLVSPKLAETVAKEIGAQTLVFNPLEGLNKDQENSGENYITIQKENLANLRIALECQ